MRPACRGLLPQPALRAVSRPLRYRHPGVHPPRSLDLPGSSPARLSVSRLPPASPAPSATEPRRPAGRHGPARCLTPGLPDNPASPDAAASPDARPARYPAPFGRPGLARCPACPTLRPRWTPQPRPTLHALPRAAPRARRRPQPQSIAGPPDAPAPSVAPASLDAQRPACSTPRPRPALPPSLTTRAAVAAAARSRERHACPFHQHSPKQRWRSARMRAPSKPRLAASGAATASTMSIGAGLACAAIRRNHASLSSQPVLGATVRCAARCSGRSCHNASRGRSLTAKLPAPPAEAMARVSHLALPVRRSADRACISARAPSRAMAHPPGAAAAASRQGRAA